MGLFTGSTFLLTVNGQVTSSSGQVRKVVNVFAYGRSATTVPLLPIVFVQGFESFVWGQIAPLLSADYVGVEYTYRFPCSLAATETATGITPSSGGTAGDRLPTSQAVNVRFLSASRGKSYTGLKRFGPIAESDTTGDELTAAAATAWTVPAGLMTVAFVDSAGRNWEPFVFSRKLSPPPGPLYRPWFTPITAPRINLTLGFARHRRERTNR